MKAIFATIFAIFITTAAHAHPGHGGHLMFAGGKDPRASFMGSRAGWEWWRIHHAS